MLRPETARARDLRNNATEAERILWQQLRARKMNGVRFNRQVRIGPYFCDFVARSRKLIVEIDGGHHNHENGRIRDEARTAFLHTQGYHLIRFWNSEVSDNLDGVLNRIKHVMAEMPSPNPSRTGGGSKEPRSFGSG